MSESTQMVVAVIPDLQKGNLNKLAAGSTALATTNFSRTTDSLKDVRRPTRGIQIKEDTYATIRLMLNDGTTIKLVNAGSRTGGIIDGKMVSEVNSNFFIQQVQEERVEKSQIVETFGEAFIFFFGERPRVLSVQGALLNTFDFNWEAEWWWNYDNYLRGTKCVEQGARLYLMYDETLVSGYVMATSSTKQSEQRNFVPFSFQLFVTDWASVSRLGDPDPNPHSGQATGESNEYLQRLDDYGPMRIDPTTSQIMGATASGAEGLFGKLSLFERMATQAVAQVQNTWARLNQIVDNVLLSADSMLGGPVRIPVGFQGALAFDDDKTFVLGEPGLDEPIQYTTKFGDNDDEFVGTTAQYQSSSLEVGLTLSLNFMMGDIEHSQDEMLAKAIAQWAANGLIVPPESVTKAVGFLSMTGVGLSILKGARTGVAGLGAGVAVVSGALTPVIAGASNVTNALALGVGSVATAPAAGSQLTAQGTVLKASAAETTKASGVAVDRARESGVDAYKGFSASPGFQPIVGGQSGEFSGTST